jgi:hypothetical protein
MHDFLTGAIVCTGVPAAVPAAAACACATTPLASPTHIPTTTNQAFATVLSSYNAIAKSYPLSLQMQSISITAIAFALSSSMKDVLVPLLDRT